VCARHDGVNIRAELMFECVSAIIVRNCCACLANHCAHLRIAACKNLSSKQTAHEIISTALKTISIARVIKRSFSLRHTHRRVGHSDKRSSERRRHGHAHVPRVPPAAVRKQHGAIAEDVDGRIGDKRVPLPWSSCQHRVCHGGPWAVGRISV